MAGQNGAFCRGRTSLDDKFCRRDGAYIYTLECPQVSLPHGVRSTSPRPSPRARRTRSRDDGSLSGSMRANELRAYVGLSPRCEPRCSHPNGRSSRTIPLSTGIGFPRSLSKPLNLTFLVRGLQSSTFRPTKSILPLHPTSRHH